MKSIAQCSSGRVGASAAKLDHGAAMPARPAAAQRQAVLGVQPSDPLAILLTPLPQLAELADAEGAEPFLPAIERLLADAELPADLADRCPGLGLAERQRNLLVGELARLHSNGPPSPAAGASGDRSLAQ